jgi:hypothetical protein
MKQLSNPSTTGSSSASIMLIAVVLLAVGGLLLALAHRRHAVGVRRNGGAANGRSVCTSRARPSSSRSHSNSARCVIVVSAPNGSLLVSATTSAWPTVKHVAHRTQRSGIW